MNKTSASNKIRDEKDHTHKLNFLTYFGRKDDVILTRIKNGHTRATQGNLTKKETIPFVIRLVRIWDQKKASL